MEFFLVVWFGLAIVAAVVARSKGRSGFGYFLLSCVFSFLVAIIVLAIVPTKVEYQDDFSYAVCPFCREDVKEDAIVCKHCGRDIEPILTPLPGEFANKISQAKPISASGKWGVALILGGSIAALNWLSAMKDWALPENAGVPFWQRIVTLVVELGLIAFGIYLYQRAIRRANAKSPE